MPTIWAISSDRPLSKTYTVTAKGVECVPYPHVRNVTSQEYEVNSARDLYYVVLACAQPGSRLALLKGALSRHIQNDSRAGLAVRESTKWLCLDFDNVSTSLTPEQYLAEMGIKDVSYTLQWSASNGLKPGKQSFHVFMLLKKPVYPDMLKLWLRHMNLSVTNLKMQITLTASKHSLHWPCDVSIAQEDKLIFVAAPTFEGLEDPMKGQERVVFVQHDNEEFDLDVAKIPNVTIVDDRTRKMVDELRQAQDLKVVNLSDIKMHNGVLYQPLKEKFTVTDRKTARGFVYYNINGGDSWGYYHPEENATFLYNFKGEPAYLMAEVLPAEYKKAVEEVSKPLQKGKTTSLVYFDMVYSKRCGIDINTENRTVTTPMLLESSHAYHSFIENRDMQESTKFAEMKLQYLPTTDELLNFDKNLINTFKPSRYMLMTDTPVTSTVPKNIQHILDSVFGTSDDSSERFLHWLAYIFQTRRPTHTAWVITGVQGTGKGILFERILQPLLGADNTFTLSNEGLNDSFNTFMGENMLVYANEIEIDTTRNGSSAKLAARLKAYITDKQVAVRGMYRAQTNVDNYTNWIFASNKRVPLIVEKGDRRFNVAPYQLNKIQITQAQIDAIEGELAALAGYLKHLKVDEKKVFVTYVNNAKQNVISGGRSVYGDVVEALITGNLEFFVQACPSSDIELADMRKQAFRDLVIHTIENLPKAIAIDDLANAIACLDPSKRVSSHIVSRVLRQENLEVRPAYAAFHRKTKYSVVNITWHVDETQRQKWLKAITDKTF